MRRREFLGALGSTAIAWPLTARARQPATPVIGFLDSRTPDAVTDRLRGFRQGLRETGHVEGENVAIAYRWAENQNDRLPGLAADLVRRKVAVIITSGPPARRPQCADRANAQPHRAAIAARHRRRSDRVIIETVHGVCCTA
jgi:putative tryptophan/tyrosine transport system substrate-binding protein